MKEKSKLSAKGFVGVIFAAIALAAVGIWVEADRLFFWFGAFILIMLLKLRMSGYKGLSTIFFGLAVGLLFYAAGWLVPAGILNSLYLPLLFVLAISVGFWDQSREPF